LVLEKGAGTENGTEKGGSGNSRLWDDGLPCQKHEICLIGAEDISCWRKRGKNGQQLKQKLHGNWAGIGPGVLGASRLGMFGMEESRRRCPCVTTNVFHKGECGTWVGGKRAVGSSKAGGESLLT